MNGHPIFARLYDRMLAGSERAGLSEMREELLAQASGRTLEIGAGTGLNLQHYPSAVTELVLAEPDPSMVKQLRAKAEADPPAAARVDVVEAPAEDLPFDDAGFDTVVSTLVLCTVEDPGKAIAEVRRVLADGGAFLFLEHVRGKPGLARWQDLLERPWGFIAGGCHPNRATGDEIAASGMWIERLDDSAFPKAPPIAKPMISGVARRPSGASNPDY